MAPGELGRVIGRQGRTAAAVRTLAAAAGELDGLRVVRRFPRRLGELGPTVWTSMVTVGRIVRPQGNRGRSWSRPETDFAAERFAAGATVHCVATAGEADAGRQSIASREHDGRWVVGFDGRRDRSTRPRRCAGRDCGFPPRRCSRSSRAGTTCTTSSDARWRLIERATAWDWSSGSTSGTGAPMLVVRTGRGEVLVPFARGDLPAQSTSPRQRIVIDPPDGD